MKVHNKFLTLLVLSMIIGMVPGLSQTVTTVEAGLGTLPAAVAAASPGDILELTTDGGVYYWEDRSAIGIAMELTIKAADGLTVMPVILNNDASQSTPYLFRADSGANLTLKGLDLDGRNLAGTAFSKYLLRTNSSPVPGTTYGLKVYDCNLHDTAEKIFRAYAGTHADTVIFENCTFSGTVREIFYLGDGVTGNVPSGNLWVTNCTGYNIGREIIYTKGGCDFNVTFDNCTFDNIATDVTRRMMRVGDAAVFGTDPLPNVQVMDCIFSNQGGYATAFTINGAATSSFTFSDTFNVGSMDLQNGGTVSVVGGIDPMYADAANADFTLPTDSPLLTLGSDGGYLGDYRWTPQEHIPTTIYVPAGLGTLTEAVSSAGPGDVIELITSGGVYYWEDRSAIGINMKLSIVASEGLEQKPVILNNDASQSTPYLFRLEAGADVVLKGLDLDGRNLAGTPFSKYILRPNSSPVGIETYAVKVIDCYLHDTAEKIFRAYPSTYADSVLFEDCVMKGVVREVLYVGDGALGNMPSGVLTMRNTTVYDIGREVLYNKGACDMEINFEHCTFDSIGMDGDRRILRVGYNATAGTDPLPNVQVINCIMSNQGGYSEAFEINGAPTSSITYCDTFAVGTMDMQNGGTVDMLYGVDPEYLDSEAGNFTLPLTSALRTMGSDGGPVGDLRWTTSRLILVEAGNGTLPAAVSDANPGDIIELVTDGGIYYWEDRSAIGIDKPVTIRAAAGLGVKPIILNNDLTQGTPYLFRLDDGGELTLEGLDLDGRNLAGNPFSKYILRTDSSPDPGHTYSIDVENCYLHDSAEKIFRAYPGTTDDLVKFNNCEIQGMVREVIYLGDGATGNVPAGTLIMQNTTVYNTGREIIYTKGGCDFAVTFDHCTFDNIATDVTRRMMRVGDAAVFGTDPLPDVQVIDCIFSNQGGYATAFTINGAATSSFTYADTFNVGTMDMRNGGTVANLLAVDPGYLDAAGADFRLPTDSPLRTASSTGGILGDPRWELDPNMIYLHLMVQGEGTLTPVPEGPWYAPGTSVTLTATPAEDWMFVSWVGVSTFPPNNPVVTFTMSADREVTAIFERTAAQYEFDLMTYGYGHVNLIPPPDADGEYYDGTEVTMTAVADSADWVFDRWEGAITGTENPVTFSVDSAMAVTAWFVSTLSQYTLAVEAVGLGSVGINPQPVPGFTTYDAGTVVTLDAVPAMGWQFDAWTGDLVSSVAMESITMDANKVITATFGEIPFAGHTLEIDTTWDLYDAVQFVNNNSQVDSLLLITSGGVYTTDKESTVRTEVPIVIKGADGLAEKPILTNSNLASGKDEIIRGFDDLTLENLVMSGSTDYSIGMQYGVRYRHHSDGDSCRNGSDVTFRNVDFRDFFIGGNPASDGFAFKIDGFMRLGNVIIDGCTFANMGYEALRMSNTENDPSLGGCLDSLYVGNCTFTNIDAEGIRYYSDLDEATPDAPVVIEHCTFVNSATRVLYLKNSTGAIVRDLVIANSRLSGHGRDADLMDAQGIGTIVTHIDTFNVLPVPILGGDNAFMDEEYFWGVDPRFADAVNGDYTLTAASHLYGMATDGEALGDLRWATETPTHVSLTITTVGNGSVTMDPMPEGYTYDPGQIIALTAVPDSGYAFVEWGGDASGTNPNVNVELNASKAVTATFQVIVGVDPVLPKEYALDQNYPNPFNPTTNIKFALKEAGTTNLTVYDITGRTRAVLVDRHMEAGFYEMTFMDANLSSGIYFYRLTSGNFNSVKKMILVK